METQETPAPRKKSAQYIWETAKVIIIALAIVIPVRFFLIQPFYVQGDSMEPNFIHHEYLVVNVLGYHIGEAQRSDVVVLRSPTGDGRYFIKRVIGMPGETVEVKNNVVFINEEEFDESAYLDETVRTKGNIRVELGDDEYYLLGDNRGVSLDSRTFGAVSSSEFTGRAWLRLWPLSAIDVLERL